jgi:hypothetical protein
MWRAVQAMRIVDAYLKVAQSSTEGKMRLMAIHFNRFILHLVFQRLGPFDGSDTEWNKAIESIGKVTEDVLNKATDAVVKLYPGAYVGSLFKNAKKSKAIAAEVNKPNTQHTGDLFDGIKS